MEQVVAYGQAFAQHYYTTFDTNRPGLAPLYGPDSIMTFESNQVQGAPAIVTKLTELPFQRIQHVLTKVDVHPTVGNGILVSVLGQLKTDDDPPHSFMQCFVLRDAGGGSYYIFNDIFRLVVHNG